MAALLELHLGEMHALSPACKVHAMPVERLRQPDVTFYSAWDGDDARRGRRAQARSSRGRGELKSMRAAPDVPRQGRRARRSSQHLIAEARRRGYTWLGLETGRPEPCLPARTLYRKHGFAECAEFGDYVARRVRVCMARAL